MLINILSVNIMEGKETVSQEFRSVVGEMAYIFFTYEMSSLARVSSSLRSLEVLFDQSQPAANIGTLPEIFSTLIRLRPWSR